MASGPLFLESVLTVPSELTPSGLTETTQIAMVLWTFWNYNE